MADEVQDDIQKRIDALPPEVRNLVYSPEMDTAMQQIGAKHQLHVDQIGELETEVIGAMIGISPLQELAQNISDTLSIDKAKADLIVAYINNQLLSKIRTSMKQSDAHTTTPAVPSNPTAVSTPLTDSGKSVVMPSAAKAAEPEAPKPIVEPKPAAPSALSTGSVTIPSIPSTAPTPEPTKPATAPAIEHVEMMLTEPTVSVAPSAAPAVPAPVVPKATEDTKVEPPTPGPIYKTDPYHEPID